MLDKIEAKLDLNSDDRCSHYAHPTHTYANELEFSDDNGVYLFLKTFDGKRHIRTVQQHHTRTLGGVLASMVRSIFDHTQDT